MKKLMTLMLGAALAIGSVSVYAATTSQDQKETPKKKGTGKKGTAKKKTEDKR